MSDALKLFEIECKNGTAIVTPTCNLSEFQFEELNREAKEAFHLLEQSDDVRNVVFDFHNTDYFGSTALGLFVKLWLRVCRRHGRMAFCNLSENE